MKKIVAILSVIGGLSFTAFAQGFEGTVQYHRVMDPAKMFANNPNAQRFGQQMGGGNFSAQVSAPTAYFLTVKGDEFSYKIDKNTDPGEVSFEFNGERRSFRRPLDKTEYFFNLAQGDFNRYEEYVQQPFYVSGKVANIRWKVDPLATKQILGHACMKATASESEQRTISVQDENEKWVPKDTVITTNYTAWFTDEIASQAGPEKYFGLPGLILGVDINDGAISLEAKKIEEKAVNQDDLKITSKGKKVSSEQLDKIKKDHQADQMKNMRGRVSGMPMMMGRGE